MRCALKLPPRSGGGVEVVEGLLCRIAELILSGRLHLNFLDDRVHGLRHISNLKVGRVCPQAGIAGTKEVGSVVLNAPRM